MSTITLGQLATLESETAGKYCCFRGKIYCTLVKCAVIIALEYDTSHRLLLLQSSAKMSILGIEINMKFRAKSARPAFTLVELLVVIGIIALLISILLPALSKARESANTVKCLANIRSLAQAAITYASANKGCILPAQYETKLGTDQQNLDGDSAWPNLLVDGGYIQAPDSTGKTSSKTGTAFYCPSARDDMADITSLIGNSTTIPADRNDDRASMTVRYYSQVSKTSVDCWFGINGDIFKPSTTGYPGLNRGLPSRRICWVSGAYDPSQFLKATMIRRSSDMVMLFDGVFFHHTSVNANRVTARHSRKTKTNMAFFDGHAATFETNSLPGGMKATVADFSLTNLNNNFPAGSNPMWMLDQQ